MRTPQYLLDDNIRASAAPLDAHADDDVLAARGRLVGVLVVARDLLARVLSDDEFQALAHDGLCRDVEAALSALDDEGLPYAGPTRKLDDAGDVCWIARERWDADDAAHNLERCVQQWGAEHPRTQKLRDYVADRFGSAEETTP